MLLVERWILARLRHRQFFSLAELNEAIAALVTELNERAFKTLPGSRRSQFETLERPALKSLPREPYRYTEIKAAKVGIDYHVGFAKQFYSVPHQLVGQSVSIQATDRLVTIFHQHRQVAQHARSHAVGGYSTREDHMPANHRGQSRWTPQRLQRWGHRLGTGVGGFVEALLAERDHPEQGYRACLGLLSLSRDHGAERLDQACHQALRLASVRVKTVDNILRHRREQYALPIEEPPTTGPEHDNVRGAGYYQ